MMFDFSDAKIRVIMSEYSIFTLFNHYFLTKHLFTDNGIYDIYARFPTCRVSCPAVGSTYPPVRGIGVDAALT